MMRLTKRIVRRTLRRVGYDLTPVYELGGRLPSDFDDRTQDVCRLVGPFTMTSPERIYALRQSIQYLAMHHIQGDIVECGVWKGGSMMAVALTLLECGLTNRTLHLFDTFDGMTTPTQEDVNLRGELATDLFVKYTKGPRNAWARSSLDEVTHNLETTGYPLEHMVFIKGRVEETIPLQAPARIALLRLDTDWYASTYHELLHLYPRLSPGGVLIIDDYGHWAGSRKAVDRYVAEHALKLLLHRIDYTGRMCVKLF
jgi:O-methyltransferase